MLLNQHTEQAITILEKAREVFSAHGPAPVHAECLAALGQAWLLQGHLDQARLCFQASQQICPSAAVQQWLSEIENPHTLPSV